jgi:hypothetical protein
MRMNFGIVVLLLIQLQGFGQTKTALIESGYYFQVTKTSDLRSKNDVIVIWDYFVPSNNIEIFLSSEKYENVLEFFSKQSIFKFSWSFELEFYGCCRFGRISDGRKMDFENMIPADTLLPFIIESTRQTNLLEQHKGRNFMIRTNEFVYSIEVSNISGEVCRCIGDNNKGLVYFKQIKELERISIKKKRWFKRRIKNLLI